MEERQDFLLEILCEEIPYRLQFWGEKAVKQAVCGVLDGHKISYGRVQVFSTPRRIGLHIEQVETTLPPCTHEVRGPRLTAAKEIQEKFAQKWQGYQLTEKNGYTVALQKPMRVLVKEVLSGNLKEALSKSAPPLTMKWPGSTIPWPRPIRGIVCLLGKDIVALSLGSLKANRMTKGHRLRGYQSVRLASANRQDYVTALLEAGVMVSRCARKALIVKELGKHASEEALLEEVSCLVEYPHVVRGKLESAHLSLPEELQGVIAKHQKSFLSLNCFATVADICPKSQVREKEITNGYKRVLQARLKDALFFCEQDRKKRLKDYLSDLKMRQFYHKLGSLYEKSLRIEALSKALGKALGLSKQKCAQLSKAALLCKADLATQLVGEFPSLQGSGGAFYGSHEGLEEEILATMRSHYQALPSCLLGCVLSVADKLDTIVGLWSVGQQPTGSKDPLALRRKALGVINILAHTRWQHSIESLINLAWRGYNHGQLDRALLLAFFKDRVLGYLKSQGYALGWIRCAMKTPSNRSLPLFRILALLESYDTIAPPQDKLIKISKRVSFFRSQFTALAPPQENLLKEPGEKALFEALSTSARRLKSHDIAEAFAILTELSCSVEVFLDTVKIQIPDEQLSNNRLSLLKSVEELIRPYGEFTEW